MLGAVIGVDCICSQLGFVQVKENTSSIVESADEPMSVSWLKVLSRCKL